MDDETVDTAVPVDAGLLETLQNLIPSTATIGLVVLGLFVVHRYVLKGRSPTSEQRFRNQTIMLSLVAVGILIIIMALPIENAPRGQILGLLGILLSAAIALSSTTLLGNAMAGIMLRAVRSFRLGDFIQAGDHFGRVSGMGLFHTEVQSQDRDLTTLPNLYLVTNAVKRIRPSGTIVSAEVSLGYDVPWVKVETLLLQAAKKIKLQECFVRIIALGDYTVSYKVAGLLTDVKLLLVMRSNLRAAMLDALHGGGVEILSPRFETQRVIPENKRMIPAGRAAASAPAPKSKPVKAMFDKAEEAASLDSLKQDYTALKEEIAAIEDSAKSETDDHTEDTSNKLEQLISRRTQLEEAITIQEEKASQKD